MSETATVQQTITDIANGAVIAYLKSDKGVAAIEAQVAKTVQEAIRSTLGEYSEFGKQVKEAVAKAFAIHGDIDLPTYNHTILQLIGSYVEKARHDSIQQQVAERMKFLLEPAPAEILLSDRKYLHDKSEAGCVCDSSQNFHVRFQDDAPYFFKVALSEDEPTKHSPPDIMFGVSLGIGAGPDGAKRGGEIYTLSFDNAREVERQLFVGPLYGFERLLFQMHAAKSKVVIDVEDASEVDTYYGRGEG